MKDEKDERRELDKKYFERLDDLNEARPIFKGIEDGFLTFAQNILDDYKTERSMLEKKLRIEKVRENYKLDLKSYNLLPRRRRNWKKFFRKEPNLAKQLLDEEVEIDTQSFFEMTLKRLREQKTEEHIQTTDSDSQESHSAQAAGSATSDDSARLASESPVQRPVTKVEAQQFIIVYVAGYVPPAVIELAAGADPSDVAPEDEPPEGEDPQDGEAEIEVQKIDDFGIDTEYKIVEDDEEDPGTPKAGEDPADKPENGLVAGEETETAQAPEPCADEPPEGVQDNSIAEEEQND